MMRSLTTVNRLSVFTVSRFVVLIALTTIVIPIVIPSTHVVVHTFTVNIHLKHDRYNYNFGYQCHNLYNKYISNKGCCTTSAQITVRMTLLPVHDQLQEQQRQQQNIRNDVSLPRLYRTTSYRDNYRSYRRYSNSEHLQLIPLRLRLFPTVSSWKNSNFFGRRINSTFIVFVCFAVGSMFLLPWNVTAALTMENTNESQLSLRPPTIDQPQILFPNFNTLVQQQQSPPTTLEGTLRFGFVWFSLYPSLCFFTFYNEPFFLS
jgi:hypothetical protein